jgi:hypothetical protein
MNIESRFVTICICEKRSALKRSIFLAEKKIQGNRKVLIRQGFDIFLKKNKNKREGI